LFDNLETWVAVRRIIVGEDYPLCDQRGKGQHERALMRMKFIQSTPLLSKPAKHSARSESVVTASSEHKANDIKAMAEQPQT
jgi:hypothetical protein